MTPSTLLPCLPGIRIESIASTADSIVLRLAATAPSGTNVGDLCKELGITRQTLYRHVAPDGALRADGQKLLHEKQGGSR